MDSSAKIGCLHATLLGGRRNMSKMSRRASKTSKTGIACANMDHVPALAHVSPMPDELAHHTYLCIGKMRRGPRSWQVARLASFRWRRCVNSCGTRVFVSGLRRAPRTINVIIFISLDVSNRRLDTRRRSVVCADLKDLKRKDV